MPMLSYHKWKHFLNLESDDNDQKFTIEHIAPQKEDAQNPWHDSLDDEDLIDSVGNLTILPKPANSSAGNKSWDTKKKLYKVLCQENNRKKKEMIEDGSIPGKEQIFLESEYLGFLKPLTQVKEWNSDFIEQRSRNILSNVWDEFYPWLNT